jgi:sugar-specific transcriptional regulator TrmB
MNSLIKVLSLLGLSELEIQIYLFLLEAQNPNISRLIEKTGVNRRIVYENLHKMHAKNLITKNHKKWECISPGVLKTQFQMQNTERLNAQNQLKKDLDQWEFLWQSKKQKAEITIIKGLDELLNIQEQILSESDGFYLNFGNFKPLLELVGADHFNNWADKRAKKGIFNRIIFQNNFQTEISFTQNNKYRRTVRLIDFETPTNAIMSVYAKDKMLIYEPKKNQIIKIENEDIVSLFRNMFEMAWKSTESRNSN